MELPACARKAGLRKGVKKMTDRDYMLRAIELAKGGTWLDKSESPRGSGDRERRKDHRGRLS